MTTENGLKLRTKLESAKTLKFTNAAPSTTYEQGEMTAIGATIGVVVESVGASGQAANDTYPNGAQGVLLYEAEKIILPKKTGAGESFAVGDRVYYSAADKALTATASGNTLCGRVLEAAGTADTEVLCDLMVLA